MFGLLTYAAMFSRRIRQLNAEANGRGTLAVRELEDYAASLWSVFKKLDVEDAATVAFAVLTEFHENLVVKPE